MTNRKDMLRVRKIKTPKPKDVFMVTNGTVPFKLISNKTPAK